MICSLMYVCVGLDRQWGQNYEQCVKGRYSLCPDYFNIANDITAVGRPLVFQKAVLRLTSL